MNITTASRISELGLGAGYALWGFRAAAIEHTDCPTLRNGFHEVFRHDSAHAVARLRTLADTLGKLGGRRINIAYPCCETITADEMSIIALLSVAQERDDMQCSFYISWLMCGTNEDKALNAALNVGAVFRAVGLQIEKPAIEITAPAFTGPVRSYHAMGQA